MTVGSIRPDGPRRRGPRPRHTHVQVVEAAVAIAGERGLDAVTIRSVAARLGAGAMSLYSYVPDKETLIYDMVEQVSAELELPPAPSGDWRADLGLLARRQRALLHRHPWLIPAMSHRQPLGPGTLAYLEFTLAVLEPAGVAAPAALEAVALLNGLVLNLVRAELADRDAPASPAAAAASQARLAELLATGRYPRFTAAISRSGPPGLDLAENFDRIVARMLDGLIGTGERRSR
ncbi:MAG TPA: TetR/AcrR family transcriptional regulator [Streptosporangiaceae bacterium]|nr:TetR/AcrR family transcriptional regulator [Streptosporangiaceae bacterium]